jgi:hypothetical protein
MYFYVDESGNTGNNLFDAQQPRLSYGLLSSVTNPDVLCTHIHKVILKQIGKDRIHASELGVGGLTAIAPLLAQMQLKMRFDFDYYFVEKPAYALISFFEAVFDAGLNDAVKWDVYWTPLRYVLIHKLTLVLDEDLLRRSWRLYTVRRVDRVESEIVELLKDVKAKAEASPLDKRTIEIIVDALNFGIAHPLDLDFGTPDHLLVSPNAVGFQFVASAMARRVRRKGLKKAASVVIDRQTQFNQTQINTHKFLGRLTEGLRKASAEDRKYYLNHPLHATLTKDDIFEKAMPDSAVTVRDGAASIGLQIVDVYLWMANRILGRKEMSPELIQLWMLFQDRGLIDGISFDGMKERFLRVESQLPKLKDLTPEQLALAAESVEKHRAKVKGMGL